MSSGDSTISTSAKSSSSVIETKNPEHQKHYGKSAIKKDLKRLDKKVAEKVDVCGVKNSANPASFGQLNQYARRYIMVQRLVQIFTYF